MDLQELLIKELKLNHERTIRAFASVNPLWWRSAESGLKTNLNWQAGHMIISHYFHGIVSLKGSDEALKRSFDPKEYSKLYGMGSDPRENLDEKPGHEILINNLEILDNRCIEIVSDMNESMLTEATVLDNPMAKTKYE
ncbi:MAG: hypothetical protein RIC15_02600, partial [Vicingaceae bacterium]